MITGFNAQPVELGFDDLFVAIGAKAVAEFGFGVPREEKKLMWEEATRECVKMMTRSPYPGYEGAYFGILSGRSR